VLQPDEMGGKKGAPSLYRLSRGRAELLVSFPAGGDASYSGLISPEPGRLIWSYYSDIAYQTGRLKVRSEYRFMATASDIYLAEVHVPN